MSLNTFFHDLAQDVSEGIDRAKNAVSSAWARFMNWLTAEKVEVIAEGKLIIDELTPVVKADILAIGNTAFKLALDGLKNKVDKLELIQNVATTVWQEFKTDTRDISKTASTTAGAFLVSKAEALLQQGIAATEKAAA